MSTWSSWTRHRRLAAAACVLSAAMAAVAAQEHATRIVSIVPALTEALFAMGAGDRVVGVGSFATHPAEVASRPRVGGLIDPDMEQIFALRPDLVLLYETQRDQIAQLRRAGIPVFAHAHGGLTDTLSVIRRLGARIGQPQDAARVSGTIETRLAALRSRLGGRTPPRVLLVFGREPGSLRNVYASGGVGFLHDMLGAAGGRNVFAAVRRESVQLTSEAILAAAPEVIVELTYDKRMTAATQAAEIAVWDRLPAVPAVRTRRVYLLLGNQFVQPGPRLADATEAIAQVLHPDAFQ